MRLAMFVAAVVNIAICKYFIALAFASTIFPLPFVSSKLFFVFLFVVDNYPVTMTDFGPYRLDLATVDRSL
jgi:hypothetical protein